MRSVFSHTLVLKAARDVGELLREVLNGAVHDRRRLGAVADQDGVEHLLADVFGWLLPERIFARFTQRFPPLNIYWS
jgi:hypothetical protein